LHEAVLNGADPSVFYVLIQAGADVNAQDVFGATPLLMAVKKSATSTVSLLLDNGANIDVQDNEKQTPLLESVAKNVHEVLKLLLVRGADCSLCTHGQSILHVAALSGDLQTIAILTDAGLEGLDVDAFDEYGMTAMEYARKRHDNDLSFIQAKETLLNTCR
jgi:ankyrin repeat protein